MALKLLFSQLQFEKDWEKKTPVQYNADIDMFFEGEVIVERATGANVLSAQTFHVTNTA